MKIIDLLKVINTKTVSHKVLDATNNIVINNFNLGYGLQFNVKRISTSIPNKHYDVYTYIAVSISDDKDNILCYADDIDYFIEILNTFGREPSAFFHRKYGRIYNSDKAGFEAIMVFETVEENSKRVIDYLALKVLNGNTIYLESVDCHVIASNSRRILRKCTEEKLVPNNLINIIS